MIRPTILVALLFSSMVPLLGQALPRFDGKLDPKLVVDSFHMYQRVWSSAADTSKFRFDPAPDKKAIISVGELIDTRVDSGKSTVLLVEPSVGDPYIWFDLNADGIYDASEKVTMDAPSSKPQMVTVTLHLPIKNAFYSTFPVFIHYVRGFKHPRLADTDRLIMQSAYANAWGHVNVAGKSVLFQYPFEARKPAISTTEGVFGVDTDGDGRIRDEQFSRESSYVAKDEIVLPLGDIFVSTSSIDMATGRIVVRQRDKKDYQRIDLEVGKEMPDFAFSDLDGKQRHLSDFRGKYVMIDFWGVWCGDCTRETPFQLAAYERFKKQNFEILGLDSDEKIETLQTYLKKNKITWTQATNDSIKDLAAVSYRIQEYPSTILLGPDGKVLVLNQHQLQGDALIKTLESILPKP